MEPGSAESVLVRGTEQKVSRAKRRSGGRSLYATAYHVSLKSEKLFPVGWTRSRKDGRVNDFHLTREGIQLIEEDEKIEVPVQ